MPGARGSHAARRRQLALALMSFTRELECAGKSLRIKQLYVGDVGCVVWDAALVLTKFLENPKHFPVPRTQAECPGGRGRGGAASGMWTGKRVIDLGSGTGVAGLAAAVMGYV